MQCTRLEFPVFRRAEWSIIVIDEKHLILQRLYLVKLTLYADDSALEVIQVIQLQALPMFKNLHETLHKLFLQPLWWTSNASLKLYYTG